MSANLTKRLRVACSHQVNGEPARCSDCADERYEAADEIERLRAENAAIRELMNVYNLGGWTDVIGPIQRALAAEARLAESSAKP